MFERVLGVIPARGRSKGVHRKNLRQVRGESLLAWAIRAADESTRLTRFVTTTDDDEIERAARELGSAVRRRSLELGADDSPVSLSVLDALRVVEREDASEYDAVVLLQPTSPLRRGRDVDIVVGVLEQDTDADCVISVCEVGDAHPARMYSMDDAGRMHPLSADWERARRQELPPLYVRNGAVYAVRRSTLVTNRELLGERPRAYVMPSRWRANIDDERDLIVANALAEEWIAVHGSDDWARS